MALMRARATRTLTPGSTGTADFTISGIGTPIAAEFELVVARTDGTDSAPAAFSRGVWANNGNYGCVGQTSEDNAADTDCYSTCSSGRAGCIISIGGAEFLSFSVDSVITDGLRLNFHTATGLTHRLTVTFYYGSGVTAHVGTFDMADNTGTPNTTLDVTAPGFQPDFVKMFYGGAAFSSGSPTINNGIEVSYGMAARSSGGVQQIALGYSHGDALATAQPSLSTDESHVIRPVVGSLGTLPLNTRHQIQLDSFLSTGFRVKDTKGSNPNEVLYLAVRWNGRNCDITKVQSPVTASTINVDLSKRPHFLSSFNTAMTAVGDRVNAQAGQFGFGVADRFSQSTWQQREVDAATTTDNAIIGLDSNFIKVAAEDGTGGNQASATLNNDTYDLVYSAAFISARFQWILHLEEAIEASGGGTTAVATSAGTAVLINEYIASGGGTTAVATSAGTGVVTPSIFPSGIASGEAFGTASLAAGAATVSPSGIASGEAFGTAALQAGEVIVSPSAIASGEAFGTAALQAGEVIVSPSAIASGEAFGTASLAAGEAIVSPSAIASGEAFGTASLIGGGVSLIEPTSIASGEAFGTASLAAGEATVSPSAIASGEAFGTAALQAGEVIVSPSAIASGEAWGDISLIGGGVVLIEPSAIASGEAFGTASLAAGEATVSPSAIASLEAFGLASVLAGELILSPSAIASGEAWGTPALDVALILLPTGIPSGEAFGVASLLGGETFISPSGIISGEGWGSPTMVSAGQQDIEPSGIVSAEAWGRPFIAGGFVKVTLKKKIHDALCEAVEHGTFIEVTYDSENCVLDQGPQVQAASIEVNELTSQHAIEERHGRKFLGDYQGWQWLLIVRFHQEVICELWVRAMLEDPICIHRDANENRQVRLKLLDAQYEHPPRENPSNGTLARFRFQAELSPR